MASSRETVRDALTTLLQTALVGAGLPCQAVYGYQVGDFNKQSPVVVVSSAGTRRQAMTVQGSRATFRLHVYAFVLYTDNAAWNEDDAEDRLDLIEQTIAGVLDTNRNTANWGGIWYGEMSACDSVLVGGEEYRREVIPVEVEVYG